MAKFSNPFSFTRHGPVTVITVIVYLAVIIPLLIVHTGVPSPPKSSKSISPLNLTEAWLDLQLLTSSYHPFNSHRNDEVHDWLLSRIKSIIAENLPSASKTNTSSPVVVFDDQTSNLTFSSAGSTLSAAGVSVYFESTNIIVYIRGSEDDKSDWWKKTNGGPSSKNGVLVNAHFDSVSTGFGATDDGIGVISILQLIRYYTTSGNKPKNGLVLLLNNGEEDFLNGASVFSQHPMSKFVSSFLNLEGAGAGGRAALFRSTDTEVTKAYAKSPFPFGTVISADGFNRGLVRSQTDYIIFNGVLGYRGLDVAFFEPRARYHTKQDDSRHTNKDSLWHMLSAAVSTTKQLTSHSLAQGSEKSDDQGTRAVWFDLFGRRFAVLRAHTLFAISVTLLVAGPLLLLVILALLHRADKLYLFSGSRKIHTLDGEDSVALNGWRGFFRFPFVLLCSCAAPVALAYLLFKENPFIAHSSEWAVWSMMISSFVFVAWFCCRVADYARPSALTRAYGFSWLWAGWWSFLVAGTIFEEQFHIAGGYFVLFYAASVFLATFLSYIELFSLPKKSKYCRGKFGDGSDGTASRSRSASRSRNQGAEGVDEHGQDEEEPTERSGLLGRSGRKTSKSYTQDSNDDPQEARQQEVSSESRDEQDWSKSLWSSLWILQILVLAPINLIIAGQIGLLLTTSLHQTGPDGSSMFLVYIGIAVFTIFLFSPIVPLLHRFTWHVPMFLFLVLVGTLIYNLIAFPFSPQNRLKLYFQQELDLDSGMNNASLIGVTPFLNHAISTIPTASGQDPYCVKADTFSDRRKCSWHSKFPNVAGDHSEVMYQDLLYFNNTKLTNLTNQDVVRFKIKGKNTRACKILFDSPIFDFEVHGQSAVDERFKRVPDAGSKEIRLWSRTWNRTWTVDVKWKNTSKRKGISGKVGCIWSDVNQIGVIPAFDEVTHYVPEWVAITKAGDGLVEGTKRFVV